MNAAYATFLFVLISVNASAVADNRIEGALSPVSATMSKPTNITEAAGRYIGAVEQLNVLKTTQCGYALKRQIPSYEQVVTDEILPAFPQHARNEAAAALNGMKQDVSRQGRILFDKLYAYYTQTEGLDNNTACGFITSTFITTRKLTAEGFERAISQRP